MPTYHTITVYHPDFRKEELAIIEEPSEELKDIFQATTGYSALLDCTNKITWYNRELDMREISANQFRELAFCIRGVGDAKDDIWQEVWFRGKCVSRWEFGGVEFPSPRLEFFAGCSSLTKLLDGMDLEVEK
jgi:hypothetical protein